MNSKPPSTWTARTSIRWTVSRSNARTVCVRRGARIDLGVAQALFGQIALNSFEGLAVDVRGRMVELDAGVLVAPPRPEGTEPLRAEFWFSSFPVRFIFKLTRPSSLPSSGGMRRGVASRLVFGARRSAQGARFGTGLPRLADRR